MRVCSKCIGSQGAVNVRSIGDYIIEVEVEDYGAQTALHRP